MDCNKVRIGTEVKVACTVAGLGEAKLGGLAMEVTAFTSPVRQVVLSAACVRDVTDNGFTALVDTGQTGPGPLRLRLKVELPDGDFPDGLRTEVVEAPTGIVVA